LLRPDACSGRQMRLRSALSGHYFKAVIDEVRGLSVGDDYYCYLREKIEKHTKTQTNQ
jgi:hypothetical protein